MKVKRVPEFRWNGIQFPKYPSRGSFQNITTSMRIQIS